jgi:hypothetical protein
MTAIQDCLEILCSDDGQFIGDTINVEAFDETTGIGIVDNARNYLNKSLRYRLVTLSSMSAIMTTRMRRTSLKCLDYLNGHFKDLKEQLTNSTCRYFFANGLLSQESLVPILGLIDTICHEADSEHSEQVESKDVENLVNTELWKGFRNALMPQNAITHLEQIISKAIAFFKKRELIFNRAPTKAYIDQITKAISELGIEDAKVNLLQSYKEAHEMYTTLLQTLMPVMQSVESILKTAIFCDDEQLLSCKEQYGQIIAQKQYIQESIKLLEQNREFSPVT